MILKSDFYWSWYGKKVKSNNFGKNQCISNEVFSAEENMKKFTTDASVWSAIYRKEFLDRNGIRFRKTPGASFQDIGFICAFQRKGNGSGRRTSLLRRVFNQQEKRCLFLSMADEVKI